MIPKVSSSLFFYDSTTFNQHWELKYLLVSSMKSKGPPLLYLLYSSTAFSISYHYTSISFSQLTHFFVASYSLTSTFSFCDALREEEGNLIQSLGRLFAFKDYGSKPTSQLWQLLEASACTSKTPFQRKCC